MAQRDARLIGGIYQVGQTIISSGMLTTYTAYNRNTGDVVGLLVIEIPPTFDAQMVDQLLQPLERRRSIESSNVIRVYDWGIDGTRAYIATDPPRGVTLRHVLDNENIDIHRALDLIRQMAQGLKVLHERGIAGIDLRPQLVTVDSVAITDRVQLDDVGLRSLLNALGYVNSQRVDDIGFLDPRYAPPEYISGGPIGPWSDVYQLALLLFEMITGRLPFVGRNPAETGILQSSAPVPRMVQYKHDAPASLQDLIDCALAKNPSTRFANAGVLLTALASLQLPQHQVAVAGERHTDGGPTTPPGGIPVTGITNGMPALQKDMTPSATLIGNHAPVEPQQALEETASIYAFLCHEKDGVEIARFAITKKDVIVGRMDPKRGITPDIDLTVPDVKMTVSRQHARIRYEETFFYIEDLKSRNKTRLGELTLVPLKPELLQHDDILHFGSVRLVFKIPGMRDRPVFKEDKDRGKKKGEP